MSECCNDLFELRELLEEMPAEFEAWPLWSCRVENEGFALLKEAGDEGLGLKHGREMWVDLQNLCMPRFLCFGFLLLLIIHQLPHTKFYHCFTRSENLKIFLKCLPQLQMIFEASQLNFQVQLSFLATWVWFHSFKWFRWGHNYQSQINPSRNLGSTRMGHKHQNKLSSNSSAERALT